MILNDLIIKIENQKDYKDMILDEINTPNIYISINELFLVKEQIYKVKEDISKIQNRIEKNKQIIKNSKENIVKITELFEKFKSKANEEIEKLKNEFSKDLMSWTSSINNSKNQYLSLLHKINLSIININIPEINKNKIEEYYIAKIKLKNNGPIPIPAKTIISLNNNNNAFRIMDKYINDEKEIQKDETVDINIKLSLINKELLKEGFNYINMRLCNEEFAEFGEIFKIKVAYS